MGRTRRLPREQLDAYLVHVQESWRPGPAPKPWTWPEIFGNENPVEIEIGCGKGRFLLSASEARPEVNFFGIEIERKYVLFTANRLAKRAMKNVRLACADARWLLRNFVPDGSVQALHVYFPDPWWKTRHRKRRLFTTEFAGECARVLSQGGKFFLLTDVAAYFDEIVTLIDNQGGLRLLAWPLDDDEDYRTNFEGKYRREGRPIYRALWERPLSFCEGVK